VVHLKGHGFIKVFRTVSEDEDEQYWASGELQMDEATREKVESQGWKIEVYHRGIKQCCGIEQAQKNHFLYALRVFLRLEMHKLRTGISWYEAKVSITRETIRAYLTHPTYSLTPTA
jgi:hypothetical protein